LPRVGRVKSFPFNQQAEGEMNNELVTEIAKKISDELILNNWKLYAVMAALNFLVFVLIVGVGAYWKKRAETYASKIDFREIKRQLKETTETVKDVEISLSHKDWSLKENKILRRTKLEELMIAIYDARNWLGNKAIASTFAESLGEENSSMKKVEMLSLLYFPELKNVTLALSNAHNVLNISSHQAFAQMQGARGDVKIIEFTFSNYYELHKTIEPPEVVTANMSAIHEQFKEKMAQVEELRDSLSRPLQPLYQSLLNSIRTFEVDAEKLMRSIVAVEAS
jgi:hypothetical protein